ncbi:helix-turn-helix domain-containing protein [Streptomyces sp. NPDC055642]
MPTKIDETRGSHYSPAHIRATWDGTGSVEDASRALGFSRAKAYDLIRSGQFPCRVLRIGRKTRVVTASLLRVLDSGVPEYNDAGGECRPTSQVSHDEASPDSLRASSSHDYPYGQSQAQ